MSARRTQKRTSKLLVLSGGKGGAGRSTLAAELARVLARHDQRVLLVDGQGAAGSLATLLERRADVVEPRALRYTPLDCAAEIEPSRLWLLSVAPFPSRDDYSPRPWLQWLRRAPVDWIVVDTPAHVSEPALALFLAAELPILVTLPEPAALIAATTFLRTCLMHTLLAHPDAPAAFKALPHHPELMNAPWRYSQLHQLLPNKTRALLTETCSRLNVALMLNQAREGSEAEQAFALAHAWGMSLGVWPRVLETIRYDERRWFFARRLAPPVNHPREDSIVADMDQLARRLSTFDWLAWAQPRTCLPTISAQEAPRRFLDLEPAAEDVRQRYRRLWEGYRREAGLVSYMLDADTRQQVLDQLDLAFRGAALSPEEVPGEPVPAPDHHPGQVLRLARMRADIGLRELSLRTRISVKQIEAIEAMERGDLPERLYLKAYLRELAKTLGLEPKAIVNDYIDRLRLRR